MTTEVTLDRSETWTDHIKDKADKLRIHFLDFVAPYDYLTDRRHFHFAPFGLEQFIGNSLFKPFLEKNGGAVPEKYQRYIESVEKVGQKLSPLFDYYVTNNWNFDARIYPGGKIVVSLGLLNALENDSRDFDLPSITFEDKIAALLSHQVIHAAARHFSLAMQFQMYFAAAVKCTNAALSFPINYYFNHNENSVTRRMDAAANAIALFILSGIGKSTSRDEVLDADRCGMELLTNAAYNPTASLWIQNFFIYQHKKGSPSHEDRLQELTKLFKPCTIPSS